MFHRAGYLDAYDLAGSLIGPNYNSFNGFKKNPIIGIRKWEGVAFFSKGRYTTLPSDHSPVMVTLTVK